MEAKSSSMLKNVGNETVNELRRTGRRPLIWTPCGFGNGIDWLLYLQAPEAALVIGLKLLVIINCSTSSPASEQISVAVASSRRKNSSRAEKTVTVYPVKGIPIIREDLLERKHMKRLEAAWSLGIDKSSIQTACRHFGYERWPPEDAVNNASSTCNVKNVNEEEEVVMEKRKKVNNDNPPSSDWDTKHVKGEKVPKKRKKVSPLCSNPPPMHATAATVSVHPIPNVSPQNDAGTVTTYLRRRGDTFRFQLQFSSTVPNLGKKVGKRFSLDEGSFDIKYRDDKNKLISIAIDEDLEEFISILRSLGAKNADIELMVLPITNQAP